LTRISVELHFDEISRTGGRISQRSNCQREGQVEECTAIERKNNKYKKLGTVSEEEDNSLRKEV
jgi:hypothetical protein